MKRQHGQHNKLICDFLNLKCTEKCNDWIVTTSFYSSIHFLDHALFPCNFEDKKFNNINEAHTYLRHKSNSKHSTRFILLSKIMPLHSDDYNFLIEQSQNARYHDYNVQDIIASRAVQSLERIIKSYDKEKKDIL